MDKKFQITTKGIVFAGLIAALYVILIALFPAISFSQVQVRIAESLALLPLLTPAAIPGLFVGCLISNIIFAGSILDIIFGSLATLVAAYLTYKLRANKFLAAAPPVLINAVVVGFILNITVGLNLLVSIFYVGIGQAVAVYAIGLPLIALFKKAYNPQK